MHSFITSVLLIVILAPGHILRLVADLPHIIVNCSRGTPSKSGVVVGVDGTGEERSAVGLGGVSGLTNSAWTIKPVQLFGSTARTVSSIWVLAVTSEVIEDQVVLAGDEPLNTAAAVDVLVAGVLHGPLPILSGAVPDRLRFLEQDPTILLAGVLKWQPALLAKKSRRPVRPRIRTQRSTCPSRRTCGACHTAACLTRSTCPHWLVRGREQRARHLQQPTQSWKQIWT